MAEHSTIEWTDATWNPITGCTMVSAGCTNCYAMGLAASRLRHHESRAGLTRQTGGRAVWTGEVRFNPQWLDQPLRWRRPRRIFVCAHGDLFHENVPDDWIDQVFAVMALAPHHTFQVLTKRPERMRDYMQRADQRLLMSNIPVPHPTGPTLFRDLVDVSVWRLPARNVWLGTSVEDQATADTRIPHLLATPTAVMFISAEPLLGPVRLDYIAFGGNDMFGVLDALRGIERTIDVSGTWPARGHIHWVIAGGESGRGARPMHPDWARSLRDQCQAAGVAFLFKQNGQWLHESQGWDLTHADPALLHRWPDGTRSIRLRKDDAGRLLDGQTWDEFPGGA